MLEEYLISEYKAKKWPFFGYLRILHHFRHEDISDEIETLIKEKKIRFREGINCKLIEIGQRIIKQCE